MELNEVTPESGVGIVVTKGTGKVSLNSVVTHVFSDCILVEPFMHEDSIISFDASDIFIEMMVTKEGESPYYWQSVRITKENHEGNVYHCIRSGLKGVRRNRRNSFRVFIGEAGTISGVGTHKAVDVTVKDLSSQGIGFLIDKSIRGALANGTLVNVSFSDPVLDASFDVTGRIVRNEELEQQTLYGCKLTKNYPMLDRYVSNKQVHKGLNKKVSLHK